MLGVLLLLLLGADQPGAGPEPEPKLNADPTRPSMVTLDAQDVPLSQVVQEISKQTGNRVELMENYAGNGRETIVNLTLPQPVPFWEAIDRLCATAGVRRQISSNVGVFVNSRARVQFHRIASTLPPTADAPAQYVGPFRFGQFRMHARYEQIYLPTRPTALVPGPHYAEFQVHVEPRVLAIRLGALKDVEATDEDGRSLIDAAAIAARPGVLGYELKNGTMIRIPMIRPESAGSRLKRLRGAIPVELAIVEPKPALEVVLADAKGKTFEVGDVAVTVTDYKRQPARSVRVAVTVQLKGPRGDTDPDRRHLLNARLMTESSALLELVDEHGQVLSGGGGASVNPQGILGMHLTVGIQPTTRDLPEPRLRVYAANWVNWDVPFEFTDLPLP